MYTVRKGKGNYRIITTVTDICAGHIYNSSLIISLFFFNHVHLISLLQWLWRQQTANTCGRHHSHLRSGRVMR